MFTRSGEWPPGRDRLRPDRERDSGPRRAARPAGRRADGRRPRLRARTRLRSSRPRARPAARSSTGARRSFGRAPRASGSGRASSRPSRRCGPPSGPSPQRRAGDERGGDRGDDERRLDPCPTVAADGCDRRGVRRARRPVRVDRSAGARGIGIPEELVVLVRACERERRSDRLAQKRASAGRRDLVDALDWLDAQVDPPAGRGSACGRSARGRCAGSRSSR